MRLCGKGYVTISCPSACPSVWPFRRTHQDSPGGSMRCGQRIFRPDKRRTDI